MVSQGSGRSRDARGVARVGRRADPLDELYLVGGPLRSIATPAPCGRAQVYLRQPDPALAGKYLDATALSRMYSETARRLSLPQVRAGREFLGNRLRHAVLHAARAADHPLPFILTSSYPHEILHNWWGNCVYVDYATGNWCEGLTAYLADHLIRNRGRAPSTVATC